LNFKNLSQRLISLWLKNKSPLREVTSAKDRFEFLADIKTGNLNLGVFGVISNTNIRVNLSAAMQHVRR